MAFISMGAIGAGGFGNVDLVQDAAGHKFARKTFSQNQPLSPELLANVLKRFQKEVRTQTAMAHRNVVPILHSDLNAVPPYYLMPLAVQSLDKDLAQWPGLGGKFVPAFSDIVAGLEYIHSMEIYHRDLKPQNVLRFGVPGPAQDYYAISDFGLVSLKESQLSVLTSTGMARGADYYTAPEVTQDLRRASVQSDIYSLGCILHDFVGDSARIPCAEIKENSPYGAILFGCTRIKPQDRFKSARAVLDAVLSVDILGYAPVASQSADFVQLLDGPPSSAVTERVRNLAHYLEGSPSSDDVRAILMKLGEDWIRHLCVTWPDEAKRIALVFSAWVGDSAFNFDYCDGMANRLEVFFEACDIEVKASCLMAMLAMGTSHNRWYVESKFMRLSSSDMEIGLANRLAIEFRILDKKICAQISHLERSIGTSRALLHSQLQLALTGICS